MELIKGANLALRFLLELCALGALGYSGFKAGNTTIAKIALGVGVPLVAAIVTVVVLWNGARDEMPLSSHDYPGSPPDRGDWPSGSGWDGGGGDGGGWGS
jgi:Protein of unknown function (DUF2568)